MKKCSNKQKTNQKKVKIVIKNIYYMLAYVCDALTLSEFEDMEKEEDFENIYDMFASVLEQRISFQLRRGLHRGYRSNTEEMTVVRGKLDMPGTVRNRIQRRYTVTCEVDEFSENNLFNQIIKTTAFLLLKRPEVDRRYKSRLRQKMMYFDNVDSIDPKLIRWNSIWYDRNNRNYRLLIELCRFIIDGMVLPTTKRGVSRLPSLKEAAGYNGKMEQLYEAFVRNYYRREYQGTPGFSVDDEYMEWQGDIKGNRKAAWRLPKMHTDITLTCDRKDGRRILIIDTKHYHGIRKKDEKENKNTIDSDDKPRIHEDNIYQIFAYVKNKEEMERRYRVKNKEETKGSPRKDKVSGLLLYARTDEENVPENIKYDLIGSTIGLDTLDLNTDFKEICGQLDKIVCDSDYLYSDIRKQKR